MKIAYVCYWDLRRRDGVTDKIDGQVGRWRAAGHEVDVRSIRPGHARLRATTELARALRSSRPDIVYLRYDLFLPPLLYGFGSAALVLELNSNVQAELEARSDLSARYERVQRRILLRRADAAVAVTRELERELRRDRPGLATAVISNGVELAAAPSAAARAEGAPRLVYVGESAYWQGVDKILELAQRFPAWRFDLVGLRSRPAPANVAFHGFLGRGEYERLLAAADVGIGTLALHRKRMDEACPLKVRRYLEFGLPVLLGYVDTDLDALDVWWLLKLPNVEENVRDGAGEIEAFVHRVLGRRVPRAEVERLVSADVKEAERLAFFDDVLAQRSDS
jgi:glycosyltransferase involved in cell wall biosynthesis